MNTTTVNATLTSTIYINNRYELLSQVSYTINAKIYKAYDHDEKKNVIIKIIKIAQVIDKSAIENEIKILSYLHLPCTPKYLDHCDYGQNAVCIVMEFFDSITLKEKIKSKGLMSTKEICSIFMNILGAIKDIHDHNIIHNDLKPENIIYLRTGGIKIIDFGISCFDDKNKITKLKGTPKYIAPEVIKNKITDKRSDIYSLGIILYEMLSGVSPFENLNKDQILKNQMKHNYVRLKKIIPNIEQKLSDLIDKAFHKNPEKRFQTVDGFIIALKSVVDLNYEEF